MKTVFSGLKPTGEMTIGNYIGAMKHWPKSQSADARTIFFIPNAHALTVRQNPEDIRRRTLDLAAWLLAVGIEPEKSILLVQSMVPAHSELFWILDNYTTMGELNRMTQFKDKSKKLGPEGQLVGLFSYPVLMAADILLYDSNEVPVGDDQVQHVELTRDIASRFNKLYGNTFTLPKATTPEFGARIMGLDDPTNKMSKSDHPDSYISLNEDADSIRNKFKRAVTDSASEIKYDKASKPAISNLIEIYCGFSDKTPKEVEEAYAGKGYGEFKSDTAELVIEKLSILQREYDKYRNDEAELISILSSGTKKELKFQTKKVHEVKQKLGLL